MGQGKEENGWPVYGAEKSFIESLRNGESKDVEVLETPPEFGKLVEAMGGKPDEVVFLKEIASGLHYILIEEHLGMMIVDRLNSDSTKKTA